MTELVVYRAKTLSGHEPLLLRCRDPKAVIFSLSSLALGKPLCRPPRLTSSTHLLGDLVMNLTRRTATVGGLSLLGTASLSTLAPANWGELNLGEGLEDFWLATDAYIYGYPLVTVEMTRRVITNVATPQATRAPMGQLLR